MKISIMVWSCISNTNKKMHEWVRWAHFELIKENLGKEFILQKILRWKFNYRKFTNIDCILAHLLTNQDTFVDKNLYISV